jgi:acyl dehydratase
VGWGVAVVEARAMGKRYPAVLYGVDGEGIRRYARVVGLDLPFHLGRKAGFRDIVAPPMFAAVYTAPAVFGAMNDPEVGMDILHNLHASQRFVWSEPVCAGDTVFTEARIAEIFEKNGKGFYVFETVSVNQHGLETARGTWTNIVRPGPS